MDRRGCGRVYSRGTDRFSRVNVAMHTKTAVKELLERLPDDCTLEDVQYHLYVLQAVERGLAQAEAGRTISHADVERQLREKWILGPGE